jgi:hypothetical protein
MSKDNRKWCYHCAKYQPRRHVCKLHGTTKQPTILMWPGRWVTYREVLKMYEYGTGNQ